MLRSLSAKLLLALSLALSSARASEIKPLVPGTYYLNDIDVLRSIGVMFDSNKTVGRLPEEQQPQKWNVSSASNDRPALFTIKQGDLFARPIRVDDSDENDIEYNVILDSTEFAWVIAPGDSCHIISTPLFSPYDNSVADNTPGFFEWFIPGPLDNTPVFLTPDNRTEICFTT